MLNSRQRFSAVATGIAGGILLAIALLLALPQPTKAAETQRPKSFAALDDDDKPNPKRPVVHSVAQDDRQRDLDALRAEVQKLRAKADMCLADLDKKTAQVAAATPSAQK